MKKSDLKQFQDLLSKDTKPRSPKTTDDLSDDLARQFDDGTALRADLRPTTGTPGTVSTPVSLPVAPARDFHKVANSISREAVPAGLFKGKSKQTYDYLYMRTRGAVVPARTVQASWREIMKGARIGSDKTLREHLKQLRAVGLVTWEWEDGAQGGSVYTVYLPEEATGTTGTGSTGSTSGQNLPPAPPVESTTGTASLNLGFQRTSEIPKTSFKTSERSDDDEAFARLRAAMKDTAGREVPASALSELDELLAIEYRIAAERTTVSSPTAFFAEHLRRRLFKKDKRQLEAERAAAPTAPKVDASECPDCGGSGYYYPEGYEKGVAPCKHTKLSKTD